MLDNILKTSREIFEATKPRQTALLLLTMLGAFLTGYFYHHGDSSSLSWGLMLKLIVMGYLAVGGTTLLNMYLDVDIDSVMGRTRSRPLPSGRLDKRVALVTGVCMVMSSLVLAWTINPYVLASVFAGFAFDIFGYTMLLKRRSSLSIFVGAIAGSMPALGGWAAGAGGLSAPAFILASLVFLWQPIHVWFLSYFYSEDYKRAGVPSLPLVVEPRVFGGIVLVFVALYVSAVILFMALTGYGVVAALLTLAGSLRASWMIVNFIRRPDRTAAWRIFKFATPLLASAFLLIPLEVIARAVLA